MNTIQEENFETINGLNIRCSVSTSENTLEIFIKNHTYSIERRRIIRHILCIILFSIIFNILIQQHSIFIVLNSIILTIIAIKCNVLINLIKFGKRFKMSLSVMLNGLYMSLIEWLMKWNCWF